MNAEQVSKILDISLSETFFRSIPEETREMLLLHAQTVAEISPAWNESIPKKILLKSLLHRGKMYVSESLLSEVTDGRSFEIWDLEIKLLGCCWQIFKMTSFTIEEMLALNWSKLLQRDAEEIGRIILAFSQVRATGELLLDVCAPHLVKEIKPNGSIHEVTIHALGPVYREATHELCGYAAVTTLRPLSN